MNKVVIFEPDVRLNDLYQSVVDSTVHNFEIITFFEMDNIEETLSHVDDEINLALVNYKVVEGNGVELLNKLRVSGKSFPVVLMCEEEPADFDSVDLSKFHEASSVYYKNKGAKELSNQIKTIIKKTTNLSDDDLSEFEYSPISPLIMLYAEEVPADVYFKKAEDDYVQIFKVGAEISGKDVQQYTSKGVNKFYILSSVKADFFDFYLGVLEEVVYKKSPKLEVGNLAIQQQVLGMVFDRLKELGPDEKMLGIAKRNIEANLELINSSNSLKKLLAKVVGKGELEFEHAMATGFLCQMILKKVEWRSVDTQYKLSLAAFFHDLFAPKFDEGIAKLEVLDEYNPQKIKNASPDFYNHPAKAAEFVEKIKDIPPDTAEIIATHHELPKAKGFPKKLFGSRTSSLGCVFNTAHYFVLKLYENGWNKEGIEITLTGMQENFKDGNYEKPFAALCEVFNF